jgi:hypothetical protein
VDYSPPICFPVAFPERIADTSTPTVEPRP